MLVFGVDVPLVELVIGFVIISLIILIEVIVVMVILMYQLRASKDLVKELDRLARDTNMNKKF